jgi:hypothetical protein
MNGEFKVYVDVAPSRVRNAYTTRHQQLFGGFSLQVADQSLPIGELMSGEFLLVLLLHWNKAIHPLVAGKSRGAKLFFTMAEGEIWVRKTAKPLWKISYIDYLAKTNRIRAEVLCSPERLEAGLLSVSRKVLAGAQKAGIWTPDCVEMERFLRSPEEYMRQDEAATTDTPKNQGRFAQQSPSAITPLARRFTQADLGPQANSRFHQPPPAQIPAPPLIPVDPITSITGGISLGGPGCGAHDARHDWFADLGLPSSDRFSEGSLNQTPPPPTITDPLEGKRQGEERRQVGSANPLIPGSPVGPSREEVLRRIARSQLDVHFPALDHPVRDALVGSLTSQWRTHDGQAGLVTPGNQFWFRLASSGEGRYRVNVTAEASRFVEDLRRSNVDDNEIPHLLHRLNLAQHVVCETADGSSIQLKMNPREQTITLEDLQGQKR